MKYFWTLIVVVVLVAAGVVLYDFGSDGVVGDDVVIDKSEWVEFESQDFDFSLSYPNNWNQNTDTTFKMSPKFNFYYQDESVGAELPFDHFSNVTQVSVFPGGVPTEGVHGESRSLDFEVGFDVSDESRVYVLDDGTPFAAYIKPETPPLSWAEAGFVWMRLQIEDLKSRCLRDNVEIGQSECDPLVRGDTIVRTGDVDTAKWSLQKEIVKSISFKEGSTIDNLIRLESPQKDGVVSSPLSITGEARGQWYFEATFPVMLADWDGRIIAEGFATAQDEWMTTDFVPFEAELTFDSPYSASDPDFMKRGSLIIHKANPSGLPENAEALEITVWFGE